MKRKDHWETVYANKGDNEVGWFERNPVTSLELIKSLPAGKDEPLLDVGGGNSFLTRKLHDLGYSTMTVLDISANALQRSKSRFGRQHGKIKWVESDILDFKPENPFSIWHDRAVFHFLRDPEEIAKYAEVAAGNIRNNGYLILAAFSTDGPESCSGLPITQYSTERFNAVFQPHFTMTDSFQQDHTTPSGNKQNFIWATFRKK
jgi:2-polyprenyl-3-methyl-5-hydroxy-6-metoxy-1,4-benzoquinol methylase